jgi:hypothetical protein
MRIALAIVLPLALGLAGLPVGGLEVFDTDPYNQILGRPEMEETVFLACQAYARLLCQRRTGSGYAEQRRRADRAERIILEMAPREAHPYLDTIKRIMEIDEQLTDENELLLRASVTYQGEL